MNRFLKSFLLASPILFLANSFAASSRLYPLASRTLDPKAFNFDFSFTRSQTLSYFDVDGNQVELDENDDYLLQDMTMKINYGYSSNIEVGADVTYRMISSSDSTYTNEASGLEAYGVNIKYLFSESRDYHFSIFGEYKIHPYTNEEYLSSITVPDDEIVLGDGGSEFSLGALFSYEISRTMVFESMLAYKHPSNNLSAEVPYRLILAKYFTSLAFWAGVEGVYSLGLDEYADAPDDKVLNANGSTYRWNSINRSYMRPVVGARMLIGNKYRLSLEGGQTYMGTSTDQAFDFTVSLSWTSGGSTREERFENSFKEYVSEATIVKVSPRGKFVKIDKGLVQDVSKGAKVDIYKADYFGGNELIAAGVIYEAGPNWAIIRLTQSFKNVPIEKGMTARIK